MKAISSRFLWQRLASKEFQSVEKIIRYIIGALKGLGPLKVEVAAKS